MENAEVLWKTQIVVYVGEREDTGQAAGILHCMLSKQININRPVSHESQGLRKTPVKTQFRDTQL